MQLAPGPILVCLLLALPAVAAPLNPILERQFTQTVRPFLDKHCTGCHGGDKPAAQFDLKPYTNMDAVVKDHPRWALILERLHTKEMPPKPLAQPPDASRKQVMDWIAAVRAEEARRNAGDPGPVLARRLSNAEYNYTIRDLTGADIRPTREFPIDPANQAGFDNTGESLTMSPALLNKYLQAAREVSDHMVLTPDGFDFAPHPMLVETDREKYAIKRIVDFYFSQPTGYADYFQAAWRYKHRRALGKPANTLAQIAAEAKLSVKYLAMVWQILEGPATQPGKPEVGPMAKLRAMWKALPTPVAGGVRESRTPAILQAKCADMSDFTVGIRKVTARHFVAPVVHGLSPTSQPLMNWKFKQFAANRRDLDRAAFRLAGEPAPPVPDIVPRYAIVGQEPGLRAAALMMKARAGNPDLVIPDGVPRADFEAAFARFGNVFPDAFFVSERGRFFPDDTADQGRLLSAGYHNVMGYYRDDTPLRELILDEAGVKRLQQLWDEFDFIADHTARTWDQYYFNQSGEILGNGRESGSPRPPDKAVNSAAAIYGLRDAYIAKAQALPTNAPAAVEAIQEHFKRVDDTLRRVEKMRVGSEPLHLDALVRFAARAYRRPLTIREGEDLLAFYRMLRDKSALTHEEAMRDSIVSVLMSPDFCYRIDLSAASKGTRVAPLDSYALASRLSYFLWSSMPDDELLRQAASGALRNPAVLLAQTSRMLKDDRARGLATEFAGNWLDFSRFEQHNGVDRGRFPVFTNELRQAMFEEPVRLIGDAIHNDRSVLDLVYGNYTFVNPVLAKHYGVPNVTGQPDKWVRVDNAGAYGRGSLLPMAVFLTQNSPGLRTSPVKRGYWVVRRILGETIPPPPSTVPELPADESKAGLPLRDMLARHRENAVCASCHARFDAFGLAFEGYGPVGDVRTADLAGRPVDSSAEFPGGTKAEGVEGVRSYIRERRQKDYLDNLCRKMLTYALGHSLMLSDELVVQRMKTGLAASGYKFSSLVEPIVTSPQFLNRRNYNRNYHVADEPASTCPLPPRGIAWCRSDGSAAVA